MIRHMRRLLSRIKSAPRRVINQYRGAIESVCERALRRHEKTIMSADPKQVQAVACTLEATLAMSESLPPGELLALTFTHEELNSFVSYIRQLDTEYRELLKIVTKQGARRAGESGSRAGDALASRVKEENPF